MSKLRFTTDDLPDYIFPVRSMDSEYGDPFGFSLVQARDNEGEWAPNWLLVDGDGFAIARMYADNFDGLSPEQIAQEAMAYVFDIHGLTEEAKIELEQTDPRELR